MTLGKKIALAGSIAEVAVLVSLAGLLSQRLLANMLVSRIEAASGMHVEIGSAV